MEGQAVTLYLDCVKHETLELLRGLDPHVSTEGVTVFGTRLLDEGVFEVGLIILCVALVMKEMLDGSCMDQNMVQASGPVLPNADLWISL